MRRSKTFSAVVALGVLLIVAAAVVRWVVAPTLAVLPGDTDTTRTYEGTAATLIDPQALSTGTGQVVLRDVPITVTSRSQVLDTDGGDAKVAVSRLVEAGGRPVAQTEHQYAVDRTDLTRGSGFEDVVRQEGITFNWPIRSQERDYTGWVPDTRQTVPLEFVRNEDRGGVSTHVYRADAAPQPIVDEQVLAALPPALPKSVLQRLVPTLGLPAEQVAALGQVLPTLPDPVPFSYSYELASTYWIEPDSGVVVDLEQRQVRTAQLAVGATPVPVAPVFDISFTSPDQTLAEAADDASDKGGSVRLVYETLPLVLLVVGLLLLLAGLAGLLTSRRRTSSPTAPRRPAPTSVR